MELEEIVGVLRSNQFSPNHVSNDAAIFQATVSALEAQGYRVKVLHEDEFVQQSIPHQIIFSMGRDQATIAKLILLEQAGATVINSPSGVVNCTRELMTRKLIAAAIPHPNSLILSTRGTDPSERTTMTFPCWFKRADFQSIEQEDVTFVRSMTEVEGQLEKFAQRGIEKVVVNEHLFGDLVKFYGVEGTPFFHWFYPLDLQHSKFGLEQINGAAKRYAFDSNRLKKICDLAAQTLEVRVYGGDCIVAEDGEIKIIDFNDWPSFAPCRDYAAPHIAKAIIN